MLNVYVNISHNTPKSQTKPNVHKKSKWIKRGSKLFRIKGNGILIHATSWINLANLC